MSDFTSNFWSVFVAGVTVISIIACLILLVITARKKVASTADNTTGHVWDEDLTEMNNPMPRWWMWLFVITIVFALGYLTLYPGLGAYAGKLGWSQLSEYKQEVAKGEAEINLCPPGGMEGVQRLADLLGREVKPLDAEEKPKQVAIIDENTCIGCTLCIQACPVDAIVGAAKQLHIIIEQQCTGCELCLPPCPVECIRMETIAETIDTWKWKYPVYALVPRKETVSA